MTNFKVQVNVPNYGTGSTDDMVLARWFVVDGASVAEGEVIAELETAKASEEIEAPATGLLRIKVQNDDAVEVGTLLAEIELE